MDCVSTKSKKIKGTRRPRARGKRASFHGCSSIEEPTNLDPQENSDCGTPIPTELDVVDSDVTVKCEKENETIVSPASAVLLELIGESSTDDLLRLDDNNKTSNAGNDEQDGSVDLVDVKESSDTSDDSINDYENDIDPVDPGKDTEAVEKVSENIVDPVKLEKDIEAVENLSENTGITNHIISDSEIDTVTETVEKLSGTENNSGKVENTPESEDSDSSGIESETEEPIERMDYHKVVNQDSDEEIDFVARSRPEDEDTAGKLDEYVNEEKYKVENDVSIQANHESSYAVFSEYVDSSIGEDVKDEASDSGEIEAGEEVLVHYMKRLQYKQLKASLRNGTWGLTSDVRSSLWYNLCHYLHKADDHDMFSEFAEDLFTPGDFTDIGMPAFVDLSHLNSYHLTDKGVNTAKQIVCVLGHSCPDIIFSPVLFSVLSIFLHYMDRSQCYNCLYSLLRAKDSTYLPTTKVSYEASKLVMRDLAKKYAKSGYVYLVRNCGNIDQMFDSWIWWIFEDLPMIFLVRVLDCYLQEGIKIFYRISLAIIILFAKFNSKKTSPKHSSPGSNVLIALRQFCREIPVPVHKLLKTCFSIKGLNRKEMHKLQVKHEMFINSQKNINSYENQRSSQLTMSKSFSGPMILQNLGSDTLTVDMLYALLTWLPTRYAICQPELLYTSEEHGTSLVTLYQRVENYQPTVIIIKTTDDEVFGAFCSTYWRERRQKSQLLSYFGTGETFVFTLSPEKKKYDWVGLSDENIPNTASMFQAGDRSILTIGGGHGEAIYLDETMLHCRSVRCDTFNNEPLSQSEDFVCKVVEVYGFQ